jgi:hypothetical protein
MPVILRMPSLVPGIVVSLSRGIILRRTVRSVSKDGSVRAGSSFETPLAAAPQDEGGVRKRRGFPRHARA